MLFKIKLLSVLITLLFSVHFSIPTYANDSTATVAAGGIRYKVSKDISMDEEILKLSVDKIDVSYRFFNHASTTIKETIAFPLPVIPYGPAGFRDDYYPTWDEEYYARQYLDENPKTLEEGVYHSTLAQKLSLSTFINFERTVNGERQPHQHQTRAELQNGQDVTEILKAHNIPLSIMYLRGFMEAGKLEKDKGLRRKIQKLGLLNNKGEPLWQTRTIYYWTQYFDPKSETIVGHTYRPHPGFHWLSANNPEVLNDVTMHFRGIAEPRWSDFCVKPSDERDILNLIRDAKGTLRVQELQYVLKTGANWKGAIKKFRLEITPPQNTTKTLFCWNSPVTRQEGGQLVSEVQNFKPTHDLRILFILKADESQS